MKTKDNCGFHIHIDISDFSPEQVGIMIARWLKIEFYVMSACPMRRLNNPYCQLLNIRKIGKSYYPEEIKRFWDDMAPRDLGSHENHDKRFSVNTIGYRIGETKNPYHSKKTVEFRFPECLLKSEHIKNWIRLLILFVQESKNSYPPNNVFKCVTLVDSLRILGFEDILDEDISNVKCWFLNKIVKESIASEYASQASDLLAFTPNF